MAERIIDIEGRADDYKLIEGELWRTELGLRSICVMYDEHSPDKKSGKNIFLLKDNIEYRLFSAAHQYLIFLQQLRASEVYLESVYKEKPGLISSYIPYNPYFEKVELELSSIFDSIIFQLSSVFDYLSHMICYICKNDKSKTVYWTKLAQSSRGLNNEFSSLKIKTEIDEIDRTFVGRLYDYRSRLLHNARDRHNFTASLKLSFEFDVVILSSERSLKVFKLVKEQLQHDKITLTFLSSWLIKQTFKDIEVLLDALQLQIHSNSHFEHNRRNPKIENGFMIISVDPTTRTIKPSSDGLWDQYKSKSTVGR